MRQILYPLQHPEKLSLDRSRAKPSLNCGSLRIEAAFESVSPFCKNQHEPALALQGSLKPLFVITMPSAHLCKGALLGQHNIDQFFQLGHESPDWT